LQELSRRAMEMDPTYKPADFRAFYTLMRRRDRPSCSGQNASALEQRSEAYIDQAGPDPVVTAATSTAPHTRLAYGPHGRRIDCYALGENIYTLSSDAARPSQIPALERKDRQP